MIKCKYQGDTVVFNTHGTYEKYSLSLNFHSNVFGLLKRNIEALNPLCGKYGAVADIKQGIAAAMLLYLFLQSIAGKGI